ncbi:molybdopterin oxidoreductase [Deltaproteobacteria bacterium]|nr:molybdopterin oxidoreductase [Deltaproteobacteria bacterium]
MDFVVNDPLTWHPSACPLDCPDGCSLEIGVHNGRVVRVRGTRASPWTEGYICQKVGDLGARVHGPARVRVPHVRRGEGWEPVTWDDAMGVVAERFGAIIHADGPEALLPVWYGGSNGALTGGGLDVRLWNRLGVSQCDRTLCATNAAAGTRGVYGEMDSASPADVDHAQLVVLWGANPSASGIHLVPPLKRLRERGGTLVVVDPRRTPLAALADLHVAVLPGTDVPVALAMIHVAIRDGLADEAWLAAHSVGWATLRAAALAWSPARAGAEAGIEPRDLERMAHLYAAASPALIRIGWGVERTRNGSDSVRAVASLPAVFGKFGVRGGGFVASTSGAYRVESNAWQGTSTARRLNLSRLAHELETRRDPSIRGLYIYNCNPVATVPDQRLLVEQLRANGRFVVVHEQVWTDTCALADVVLPATTFAEHADLTTSYGSHTWQYFEPVVAPEGESRSNHQVMVDLGRRLGVEDPMTEAELAAAVLASSPKAPSWEELRMRRAIPFVSPVQFVSTFPDGGQANLSPAPEHLPPPAFAELPLVLISPATARAISSTFYESAPATRLGIYPEDAAKRGIAEGDRVRMWNPLGEVFVGATLDPTLRPGVVCLPKGLWRRATENGWTSNALIPGHVDRLGLGACYNDARVEVEAAR